MLNYLPVEHFNENVFRAYTIYNHKTIKNVSVTLFNGRLTDNDTVSASKLKKTHTVRIEGLNGMFVEATKQEILDVIIEMLKTRSEPLKSKHVIDVFVSLSPEVNVTEDHAIHEPDTDIEIALHNCVFNLKFAGKHRSRKEKLMMQLAQVATEAERKRMELIREYVETFDVTGECNVLPPIEDLELLGECPPVLSANGTSLAACFTKAYNQFFCKQDLINLMSISLKNLIKNDRTMTRYDFHLTYIQTEDGLVFLITPKRISSMIHRPAFGNVLMSLVSEYIDQLPSFENRQTVTLVVDDRVHFIDGNSDYPESFTVTENGLLTTAEGRSCFLVSSDKGVVEGKEVDAYMLDNMWKLTKRTLPCVKALRPYLDESSLNQVEFELECVKASLDGLSIGQAKAFLIDAARRIEMVTSQQLTPVTLLTKGAMLKSTQLGENDRALLRQSNRTVLSEMNLEGRVFRFMFDKLNMEESEAVHLCRREALYEFLSEGASTPRGWFD